MAAPKKFTVDEVAVALKANHGLISLTADALACCDNTVKAYIKGSKRLQTILSHYRRKRVDNAEFKLDDAIERGEPWAVQFTLSRLGKNRGYTERQEVTGKDGQAIQIESFQYGYAIAPIAPGPMGDSEPSGNDQGGLYGPPMGEDADGR